MLYLMIYKIDFQGPSGQFDRYVHVGRVSSRVADLDILKKVYRISSPDDIELLNREETTLLTTAYGSSWKWHLGAYKYNKNLGLGAEDEMMTQCLTAQKTKDKMCMMDAIRPQQQELQAAALGGSRYDR